MKRNSGRRVPGIVTELPLPAWATHGGGRQLDGEYYAVVSAVGRSVDECWNRLLNIDIAQAVYHYALHEIGSPFPYPRVDREMVDMMLVDQHVSPWKGGGLDMYGSPRMQQVYLRLHFTPAVRERLIAERAEALVSSRIVYTIWTAILACGAVGIVFAYLKLDAASNGALKRLADRGRYAARRNCVWRYHAVRLLRACGRLWRDICRLRPAWTWLSSGG